MSATEFKQRIARVGGILTAFPRHELQMSSGVWSCISVIYSLMKTHWRAVLLADHKQLLQQTTFLFYLVSRGKSTVVLEEHEVCPEVSEVSYYTRSSTAVFELNTANRNQPGHFCAICSVRNRVTSKRRMKGLCAKGVKQWAQFWFFFHHSVSHYRIGLTTWSFVMTPDGVSSRYHHDTGNVPVSWHTTKLTSRYWLLYHKYTHTHTHYNKLWVSLWKSRKWAV